MIDTVQDGIMERLRTIAGVAEVDAWQGEIEDLLKQPKRLPALYVVYQGAEFEEKKTIGANTARHWMEFLVVLVAKNLRSRAEGALTCYGILEAVRAQLIGHIIEPHGMLWPVAEELVAAVGGTLVYGMTYRMKDVDA
jgi:phage gp37-like protein